MALGFKGFAYGDKRNSAVSVLASILGGGMSSRLFTEVREKRGLGYYVRSSPGSYQDTGSFTVSAGVQVDKIYEAISVIIGELKKDKKCFGRGKGNFKSQRIHKRQIHFGSGRQPSPPGLVFGARGILKNIETPEEIFKKIDAVTPSAIQKAARDLFQNKNLTLAVIGPYKSEIQFKKILKI